MPACAGMTLNGRGGASVHQPMGIRGWKMRARETAKDFFRASPAPPRPYCVGALRGAPAMTLAWLKAPVVAPVVVITTFT